MSPYSVDKVLADAERVLAYTNPAFDITDPDRQIAREHAEMMCGWLARCEGNKRQFVEAAEGMIGTAQGMLLWGREKSGSQEGECGELTDSDWHRQERESAIDHFDEQFGVVLRKHQIQQAVNAACLILLDDEGSFSGMIGALRGKIGALFPWNWGK